MHNVSCPSCKPLCLILNKAFLRHTEPGWNVLDPVLHEECDGVPLVVLEVEEVVCDLVAQLLRIPVIAMVLILDGIS